MRGLCLVDKYLLRRGLWLWILARLVAIAVVALSAVIGGGELPNVFGPMPAAIAVTVALGFVELRRLSERVLLANLGVAPAVQGLWLAAAALSAELALAMVSPLVATLLGVLR